MAKSSGGRPAGSRARSVGAAGGKPNGAILDDTAEVTATRKQRFKAWAERYRKQNLPSHDVCFDYSKSPKP